MFSTSLAITHRGIGVVVSGVDGGEGEWEEVGLRGEDKVIHVQHHVLLLRKEQVEVLEGLSQDKGVHPAGRRSRRYSVASKQGARPQAHATQTDASLSRESLGNEGSSTLQLAHGGKW